MEIKIIFSYNRLITIEKNMLYQLVLGLINIKYGKKSVFYLFNTESDSLSQLTHQFIAIFCELNDL